MTEQLDKHPSKVGKVIRLGLAGALLAVPLTASRANAIETAEPGQPIYVSLPDWNCKQSNQLGIKDRGSLDFTRPQTSITSDILSVTYPAKRGNEDFYETVIYENPGLQSGQLLRYYSEGSDECPLPYESAPTIPASSQ